MYRFLKENEKIQVGDQFYCPEMDKWIVARDGIDSIGKPVGLKLANIAIRQEPRVGTAVIIVKDGEVLVMKRIGSHGTSTWAFPGGHLDMNESFEECVKRETMEEVGIWIKNIRHYCTTNDVYEDKDMHYVTIVMIADWGGGNTKIMEPTKCTELRWVKLNELPTPLFYSVEVMLQNDGPLDIKRGL